MKTSLLMLNSVLETVTRFKEDNCRAVVQGARGDVTKKLMTQRQGHEKRWLHVNDSLGLDYKKRDVIYNHYNFLLK